MNSTEFRKELVKTMPGYAWTVHKPGPYSNGTYLSATGIQTSGYNRLSTLEVVRREKEGSIEYEVKSSGFGKNAPWLSTSSDGTLARALRTLQTHYENRAGTYASHARALQAGRNVAVQPLAIPRLSVPVDQRNGKPLVTSAMKAVCIAEFTFHREATCNPCYLGDPNPECDICHGATEYVETITVPWDTCKEIYKAMAVEAAKA